MEPIDDVASVVWVFNNQALPHTTKALEARWHRVDQLNQITGANLSSTEGVQNGRFDYLTSPNTHCQTLRSVIGSRRKKSMVKLLTLTATLFPIM
ncbi:hypothetical protein [Phaeobacter gallaeciensis]|nr:hypothetical protein [Phaeobacter gallaeciensis]